MGEIQYRSTVSRHSVFRYLCRYIIDTEPFFFRFRYPDMYRHRLTEYIRCVRYHSGIHHCPSCCTLTVYRDTHSLERNLSCGVLIEQQLPYLT